MRIIQESINTLQAVIYDIVQYGDADPIFVKNLKNEYDNVVSRKLIMRAIDQLDLITDYNKIAQKLRKYGILIQ